jgi:Family of unknown function (DUF6247)
VSLPLVWSWYPLSRSGQRFAPVQALGGALAYVAIAALLSCDAKIRRPADEGEQPQLAYVTEWVAPGALQLADSRNAAGSGHYARLRSWTNACHPRGTFRGTNVAGRAVWQRSDCRHGRRHRSSTGPYYDAMSAQPAEHPQDPLDPQRIVRELPDRERANFLAAYREALDGARDPAGWGHLRRVLRLWSGMVIAANRPGFYEAQEAALTGTGGGMLLEDYIRLRRTQP